MRDLHVHEVTCQCPRYILLKVFIQRDYLLIYVDAIRTAPRRDSKARPVPNVAARNCCTPRSALGLHKRYTALEGRSAHKVFQRFASTSHGLAGHTAQAQVGNTPRWIFYYVHIFLCILKATRTSYAYVGASIAASGETMGKLDPVK